MDLMERAARALVERYSLSEETAKAAARAVIQAIREPGKGVALSGGYGIANQFTDPWDVLSPDEEEALGLEIDGPDAFLPANERLSDYAVEAYQAMIDAILSEGE
ncbi:MAG: hypothetical protein ABW128_15455 [Rhizorhabdus sp.]